MHPEGPSGPKRARRLLRALTAPIACVLAMVVVAFLPPLLVCLTMDRVPQIVVSLFDGGLLSSNPAGPVALFGFSVLMCGFVCLGIDRPAWEGFSRSKLSLALVGFSWCLAAFTWFALTRGRFGRCPIHVPLALWVCCSHIFVGYLLMGTRYLWRRSRSPEATREQGISRLRIALVGGVLVALVTWNAWLFASLPNEDDVNLLERRGDIASLGDFRDTCHLAVACHPAPFMALASLDFIADETSVEPIVVALMGVSGDSSWSGCPGQPGVAALETITNQEVERSRRAWRAWWLLNGEKSRSEWVADGFADAGLELSPWGGVESTQRLFAVLGEGKRFPSSRRLWRFRYNALYLLQRYPKVDVTSVMDEVMEAGSDAAKKGVARYLAVHGDESTESFLERMLVDPEREVRVVASEALIELQRRHRTNLSGTRLEHRVFDWRPQRRGVVSDDGVLFQPVVEHSLLAYDLAEDRVLWRHRDGGTNGFGTPALCGEHLFAGSSNGTLYRFDRRDGAVTLRAKVDAHAWNAAPRCLDDEAHVLLGGETVRVLARADGRVMAQSEGELIDVSEGSAWVRREGEVVELELPFLTPGLDIQTEGRAIGVEVLEDTIVLIVNDAQRAREPTMVWIEGWSRSRRERLYRRGISDETAVSRRHASGVIDGVLYLSTDRLTTAVDPATGEISWDTALGSVLFPFDGGAWLIGRLSRPPSLVVMRFGDSLVMAAMRV